MTPAIQQLSQSGADVLMPRRPLEVFLRTTLADLIKLEANETSASQKEIIAKLRNETRSHLAALLLSADPSHQAVIADIRDRLANGEDLGPAMDLDEFDAAFLAK